MPLRDRVEIEMLAERLWLVAVLGEPDLSNAGRLDEAIARVFAAGSRMLVDLSGASFIDSTVVGSLVRARQRAERDASDEFVIVAPRGSASRRVIDLTRLDARVAVYETRGEARRALTVGARGE